MESKKFLLQEKDIPTAWYNIVADMENKPLPPLNPKTKEPLKPEDLYPLFAKGLVDQEMNQTDAWIEIPEEVRDMYKIWRPTPLVRAYGLEKALDTPAHIYFKNESVSPVGSHKLNSAIPQAYFCKKEGVTNVTTETGAGQWGASMAMAAKHFGLELAVYMVKVSYNQKPYRRSMMQTFGAEVIASPSMSTRAGRDIITKHPNYQGSLGTAISEAVELAMQTPNCKYVLGSVLNHVMLHQTVIGLEAEKQMEMAGEYPDVVIACFGGGSNFSGIAFPFLRHKLTQGKDIRNVAAEQKKEVGMRLNELKTKAQDKINALKEQFESQDNGCDGLDLTRSAYPVELGTRHPLTIVKNEIIDIFARLGFSIAEGPEIEDDWHVFSALNFAEDHPARDMQDTFFIEAHPDVVLRTHTSSVQTRVMETSQPPIRIICPGRVYRNEAISYRAHCFFHQVEALYVDKDVSFTDLKQVLLLFAKEMFGADTKIRLRPSYFPFTEPSAEMDISCNICGGKGCPFCKHTGWVEILGCGMVDPNVLESNGINSKVYSGYAIGMGIERITNLKYQVKDLRMFSENDTRFLKEFESAY